MMQPKMPKQVAVPLIAICTVIFGLAGDLSAADKAKSGSDSAARRDERPTDPSLYVGAETCKTCHEDILQEL